MTNNVLLRRSRYKEVRFINLFKLSKYFSDFTSFPYKNIDIILINWLIYPDKDTLVKLWNFFLE